MLKHCIIITRILDITTQINLNLTLCVLRAQICARNVYSLTAVGAYLRPTQRAVCLHTIELSFDPWHPSGYFFIHFDTQRTCYERIRYSFSWKNLVFSEFFGDCFHRKTKGSNNGRRRQHSGRFSRILALENKSLRMFWETIEMIILQWGYVYWHCAR